MIPVVVTEPVHPDALAMLASSGFAVTYGPDCGAAELDAALHGAEAVLVRTAPLRRAGPRLRLVSKHGVGVDNIDLTAMRDAGVAVMNTPGANAGAVAEHALALMLALARDLAGLQAAARTGTRPGAVAGLEGRRLLVVGHGATGQRVAALGVALGMAVTVLSPRLTGSLSPDGHAVARDLSAALPQADVLTLHCPLTETTRGLIGAAELAALPRGALVINCARGGLIDDRALAAALGSGHLGGAGLDVTDPEPLPPDHPLRAAPRVILTPHAAAMSAGAFRRMGMEAARNVFDHFAGQPRRDHVVLAGR